MKNILFIGLGHMSSALIKGIKLSNDYKIYGYHYNSEKLTKIASELNITPLYDLDKVINENISVIIIGVRAETVEEICKTLNNFNLERKVIVSIASGVAIKTLSSFFDKKNIDIIRVMPNVNAEYQLSTTAIAHKNVGEKIINEVTKIFENCGSVFNIDEEEFNNFTVAASCMPAYATYIVNEWISSAIKFGMSNENAQKIIGDVFINSIKTWNKSGKNAQTIIDEIATPNGVTIQGINSLKNAQIDSAISNAYKAAFDKTGHKK